MEQLTYSVYYINGTTLIQYVNSHSLRDCSTIMDCMEVAPHLVSRETPSMCQDKHLLGSVDMQRGEKMPKRFEN